MARPWVWTAEKERAVELLADRRRSQRLVAVHIGVTRRTIEGWMRRPVFRERVQQARLAYDTQVRAERSARLAAWRAADDAHERAWTNEFNRRLAAIALLPPAQRARARHALIRQMRAW